LLVVAFLVSLRYSQQAPSEPAAHQACRVLYPGAVDLLLRESLVQVSSTTNGHNNTTNGYGYSSSATPSPHGPTYIGPAEQQMQRQTQGQPNSYLPPASITSSLPVGTVKAYQPSLFVHLRKHAGISEDLFVKCMDPDYLACLSSDSKSGQAFWKSIDGSIVVKTIKHYECKNLQRVLQEYTSHMLGVDDAGRAIPSCISSVIGLYRVKTRNGIKKYFMINKNVYPTSESTSKHRVMRKYDLKGSTIGRKAHAASSVMKDLNLIDSDYPFHLGIGKDIVLNALARDVGKWPSAKII
jgi:Phosphatidylinositol-4-phosphate 5-Kinase